MGFARTKLDNGLEVIVEANESALSTSLGFFVKTGSRDETDEVSGISHFLEHMAFKGGDRMTAAEVNQELDALGGLSNAFTMVESTAFYAQTLPELQERAVVLLSEILRPSLRQEDFETEKKVVMEEIQMYDDQPPYGLDEKTREYFWADHPLRRSILGDLTTVGRMTRDQMYEYHERRYCPNNMAFVACGNVDFDKLVRWVDRECGKWRSGVATRETSRAHGRSGKLILQKDGANDEYVYQVFDGPSTSDSDYWAASALGSVVGGSSVGSRIFWELVDTGRADDAGFGLDSYSDSGRFETSLVCNPADVESNLASIREIIEDVQKNGVTEAELSRAKNKNLTSVALGAEHSNSRLFAIGSDWLTTGELLTTQETLQLIRNITLDEVNAAAEKYLIAEPYTFAIGALENIEA